MLVERLHHVGICVRDLDEALAFYCGVMGFTTDPSRPDFGIDGAWIDCGPTQIHLLVSDEPAPSASRHFALRVDDLDAWEVHLTAAGAPNRRRSTVTASTMWRCSAPMRISPPSGGPSSWCDPGTNWRSGGAKRSAGC